MRNIRRSLFVKKPYKRDDILQKRPIVLRSLLIVRNKMRNIRRVGGVESSQNILIKKDFNQRRSHI